MSETENTERDYEAEAGTMGWVPAEDFKGDPDKHKTAQEFVELGEQRVPLMQSNLHKLTTRVQELQESLDYQADHNQKALKAQADQMRAEHEAQMQEAVKEGDEEAFLAAKKARDDVADPPPVPEAPRQHPDVVDFINENTWYRSDRAMTVFADSESMRIKAESPDLTVAQNLARVKASTEAEFAHKLGNPRRQEAATVGGGSKPAKTGKKTFNDLPQEAKDACAKFHKNGVFGKDASEKDAQEKYLSTYKWSE